MVRARARAHTRLATRVCDGAPLMTGYGQGYNARGGLWRLPNQLISKSHFYLRRVTTSFSPSRFIKGPIKASLRPRGGSVTDRRAISTRDLIADNITSRGGRERGGGGETSLDGSGSFVGQNSCEIALSISLVARAFLLATANPVARGTRRSRVEKRGGISGVSADE